MQPLQQSLLTADLSSLYLRLSQSQDTVGITPEEAILLVRRLDDAEWMETSLGAKRRPLDGHYDARWNSGWEAASEAQFAVFHTNDDGSVVNRIATFQSREEARNVAEHLNQGIILKSLLSVLATDLTEVIEHVPTQSMRVRILNTVGALRLADQSEGGIRRVILDRAKDVVVYLANKHNSMSMAGLANALRELAGKQKV
uniref:AbiTii domain-containing protein n=1 Tax=Pseudomonas phage Cygsa01 TaxID=3138529 RepID=A0AAU6W561_9VIRU